jgi:hypothetical protein
MSPETLKPDELKPVIFWPDKHSVLATDVNGALPEILQRQILQRLTQEAAAKIGVDQSSEVFKERIRDFLDQVVSSTPEPIPEIQVRPLDVTENSGFGWGVSIEFPAHLIPEDAFQFVCTATIYRFRPGRADEQLSKVPNHDRSIVKNRVEKWLRGRFQHAHKGRSRRRRHTLKARTLLVIIMTKERRLKPNWSF